MLCTSKEVAVAVVDNAVYVEGRRTAEPDTLDHTFEVLRDCAGGGPSFCWIGMLRPTAQEIAVVAEEYTLHPLAVEDAVKAHQRPSSSATVTPALWSSARRATSILWKLWSSTSCTCSSDRSS